jgi:hypothetical protein
MTYDYKQPRRLNFVSFLLLLILTAGGYLAFKFVPVYWQARKVDEALDEIKMPATRFHRMNDDARRGEADKIIARAHARLIELGIEDHPDQPLQLWFSPEFDHLHARYRVDVHHPVVNKITAMTMDRDRDIPKH